MLLGQRLVLAHHRLHGAAVVPLHVSSGGERGRDRERERERERENKKRREGEREGEREGGRERERETRAIDRAKIGGGCDVCMEIRAPRFLTARKYVMQVVRVRVRSMRVHAHAVVRARVCMHVYVAGVSQQF